MSKLTPEQSADVVQYYHNGNNKEARKNGWKYKVSLAQSAIQTALESRSILPADEDNKTQPLLTWEEQLDGVNHITQEKVRRDRYDHYMATPPRTNDDRDSQERAAGEDFDQD